MKDIEKIMKNIEEIMKVLEVYKNSDIHIPVVNDMHIPAPQDEPEEMPDIRFFDIVDASDIIGDGAYSKYPLFTKYEDNSHYPVINYHIMEKFIYRDDVEIRILCAIKGDGTGARGVFKPNEVTIHVGGTTLTGQKEDGTLIEIRAGDWKKLKFARVTIKKK